MQKQPVRMGVGSSHRNLPWGWIALGGIGSVVILILLFFMGSGETEKKREGCVADSECQRGNICAAGGCIILTSDENADLWHDGIDAQLNPTPEKKWSPMPHFGQKLHAVDNCPANKAEPTKGEKPGGRSIISRAIVHVLSRDSHQVLVQKQVKGTKWISSLRFRLPGQFSQTVDGYCHGDKVDGLTPIRKKNETVVDAVLSQSVPVGSLAEAAVLAHKSLPPTDEQGYITMSFEIPAAVTDKTRSHVTAFVLPLGTEIVSLGGRAPSRQRLLTGHVAYYWEHTGKRGAIIAKLKLPKHQKWALDYSEVKP